MRGKDPGREDGQETVASIVQRQYEEGERAIKRLQEQLNLMYAENKALSVKNNEIESDLVKYRKLVIFDHS